MNLLKSFFVILAGAFLVAATAFDKEALYSIIREGDHPEEIAAAFGGHWAYTGDFGTIFDEMVFRSRFRSLQACLPQVTFPDAATRDHFFKSMLVSALYCKNLQVADFLLGQEFRLTRAKAYESFWPSMNWAGQLEDIKKLVDAHPGRAADLAPIWCDIRSVRPAANGLAVVDLALHCYKVSLGSAKPGTFAPTELLRTILESSPMRDADMAAVAGRLLDLEAKVDQELINLFKARLARYNVKYAKTLQILQTYLERQSVDVKESGMD